MKNNKKLLEDLYKLTVFNRKKDLALLLKRQLPQRSFLAPTLKELQIYKKRFAKNEKEKRAYFYAVDFFVRNKVEPLQVILNEWMNGAKAQVNEEKIPFLHIISWCQNQFKNVQRSKLAKEAKALCRFLAPFSHATWQATLRVVNEELGYDNYFAFLNDKRGEELILGHKLAEKFLQDSQRLYFERIEKWLLLLPEPVVLANATRYDAIFLLGLRYIDNFLPVDFQNEKGQKNILRFFSPLIPEKVWLKIHKDKSGIGQSYCIPVEIPKEIHIIISEIHGWLELESLFHELGHALFFLNNLELLPLVDKDFYISFALSETYAFLFQLICMDRFFLMKILGLEKEIAEFISSIHKMKFLTLARRYAAKTIIELENFKNNRFSKGQKFYSEKMEAFTGFKYGEETYLFDLMPDMYSLDYFEAFLAAFMLKRLLEDKFGHDWFIKDKAFDYLKELFSFGNKYELRLFFKKCLSFELCYKTLLNEPGIKDFDKICQKNGTKGLT